MSGMNPRAQSMADVQGQQVVYYGENAAGEHQFGNGSPLVTHRFGTLDQAVARFGRRIKLESTAGKSKAHAAGMKAFRDGDIFDPRTEDVLARKGFAFGYMEGLMT